MRKTIVTALIALFVMLALVSCDNMAAGAGGGGGKAGYTADGRELVELTINSSGTVSRSVTTNGTEGVSRSLTTDIAPKEADYMEVIFKDGASLYRNYGPTPQISIKIPAKSYSSSEAIVFIGRYSDMTLLAYAMPASGTFDATSATPGNFTFHALTANLTVGGTDFVITDSGFTNTTFNGQSKTGKWYSSSTAADCFLVPTGQAGIIATLTIHGLDSISITALTPGATEGVIFIPTSGGTGITPTGVTPTAGTWSDGKISFTFSTVPITTPSKYSITFKFPVKGFDGSNGVSLTPGGKNALTWYIRGGTELGPDIPATTGADGSANEGVALVVSNTISGYTIADIVVEP